MKQSVGMGSQERSASIEIFDSSQILDIAFGLRFDVRFGEAHMGTVSSQVSPQIRKPSSVQTIQNFVQGDWRTGSGERCQILSPYFGSVIGEFKESSKIDVDIAISAAKKAQLNWGGLSLKERCQVMFRFRGELLSRLDEISLGISLESGKTLSEAKAGLLKGIEVLEFALSLQNLDEGGRMEVSRGVFCEYRREPLGVVVGVTPFNFPAMVPMWMIPIALTLGNSFVWKPSEKTPITSMAMAQALKEAGLPEGVFTVLLGGRSTVELLLDHPDVKAVGFVGSSAVAKQVYVRGSSHGKRVLALGGAKNHIILMPDADPEMASRGIVDSFTGCAGQRCMAASVLITVGPCDSILEKIKERASGLRLGEEMGAIISKESRDRILQIISRAKASGARVALDGTQAHSPPSYEGGNWLGPTILDDLEATSEAANEEIFGPVLSVIRTQNLSDALKIENANPYGNAASVFTRSGAVAERVTREAQSGMVGVNVGVPVPREPFSFGGFHQSKFGHGDITGPSAVDFWSERKKVTTKWVMSADNSWMS